MLKPVAGDHEPLDHADGLKLRLEVALLDPSKLAVPPASLMVKDLILEEHRFEPRGRALLALVDKALTGSIGSLFGVAHFKAMYKPAFETAYAA